MDKIIIEKLEVFANHGVLEAEKTLGQVFLVSLELSLDFEDASITDDLNCAVNYAEVCDFVVNVMKRDTYNLIETCAEKITCGIFRKYESINEVTVKVEKPHAPIPHGFGSVAALVSKKKETVFIGLGSNLGERENYLNSALTEMSAWDGFWVQKKSAYHETKPVSSIEQGDYLNAVVSAKTIHSPKKLMEKLLELEIKLGRERPGVPTGPRTIDLDLLFYGDKITSGNFVTLPHPKLHERLFVLEPFCEIEPMFLHPLLKKRICELRNLCATGSTNVPSY